jgi:hypothetical protein
MNPDFEGWRDDRSLRIRPISSTAQRWQPCGAAAASPTIKTVPQIFSNRGLQTRAAIHIPAATRRLDAPAPLRLWHLTSLDAPTVAAVWSLAFAWATGIRLPVWIPLLLGLTAWAVYIADRLLDAHTALRTANLNNLRERHRFHHRHRRLLVPVAICAACAATCIVFTLMPAAVRERNSALAVAGLAYFTGVHSASRRSTLGFSSFFPLVKKELLVGLLFTAACALPAFSRTAAQAGVSLWLLAVAAVFYALLAWLNCHAIDRWEAREQEPGMPQIFPTACLLAFTGLLLAVLVSSIEARFAALVTAGAVSAMLLALLDRVRSRITPLALRVAADLALLTPVALLLR